MPGDPTSAVPIRAEYDLAVVGAGIVGLAHAAAALARGLRVVVVERGAAITGASIRNFGHLGFSAHGGEAAEYAARSRELWAEWAAGAGFWFAQPGTLIVARHEDELAMLRESGVDDLLTAAEVAERAPVVGAVGGALRPGDAQVNPRTAAPALAAWLAERGVAFVWRTSALGAAPGVLHTSRGDIRAASVVFAVGHDIDHLFPELAEERGVRRCGLDMLLADGVGLGIPLLTGTSMLRYTAFAATASAAEVRARLAREEPDLLARDVNQMYTERPDGTLLVGDTHGAATAIAPFQDEDAFRLLERLGADLFGRPLAVRERWQGVYATAPEDFLVAAPADGIRIVAVTTGIGMTTGPGLAHRVVADLWGAS
jgi:FAD dependent oxidoreductase TIGR03364